MQQKQWKNEYRMLHYCDVSDLHFGLVGKPRACTGFPGLPLVKSTTPKMQTDACVFAKLATMYKYYNRKMRWKEMPGLQCLDLGRYESVSCDLWLGMTNEYKMSPDGGIYIDAH
jgi:hypothetical protein